MFTIGDNIGFKMRGTLDVIRFLVICGVVLPIQVSMGVSCVLSVQPVENKSEQYCIDLNVTWEISDLGTFNETIIPGRFTVADNSPPTCSLAATYAPVNFPLNSVSNIIGCKSTRMRILAACSYELHFRQINCSHHFDIPRCVGDVCDCSHISSSATKVNITAHSDDEFTLEWTKEGNNTLTEIILEQYTTEGGLVAQDHFPIEDQSITHITRSIPGIISSNLSKCFDFIFEKQCKQPDPFCPKTIPRIETHSLHIIIVIVVFASAIAIVLFYFVYSTRKSVTGSLTITGEHSVPLHAMPTTVTNILYPLLQDNDDPLEIPYNQLTMIKEIDAGYFGVVYEGGSYATV
ncbi:uncharacterized protein [Atheta coriaria]|uniref:uncharacterized protein isoform X1 n=1 Tax=Dalotia coriaria TaxID=877792 RepID=UPI0031F394D0